MVKTFKVLIAGSGSFKYLSIYREYLSDVDYIIAADGGLRYVRELGITPDVVVGDMDSAPNFDIGDDYIEQLERLGVEIKRLSVRKDESDMEIAIALAEEMSATHYYFIGSTGTRFDHSLFNINMAFELVSKGAYVRFFDEYQELIPIVAETELIIENREGYTLSVVPFTELHNLTLEGFDYPLNNADVKMSSALTSSNVIKTDSSVIKLGCGRALIVISDGH